MKTDDFDYELPKELIAQTPSIKRDMARLMVLDKNTGDIKHKIFKDVIDYMDPGDALVLNNTKVIPARLIGEKESTGAVIEILLLKDLGEDIWECLVKPAKRIKVGSIVSFGDGMLRAECIKEFDEGIKHFHLLYDGILMEILDRLGTMPLPPYIHEKLVDQSMYNTVYATTPGSSAAPTAGLHFTEELLDKIKEKGVKVLYVTLHVGLGTFRPVNVLDVTKHHMHSEYYEMEDDVAKALNEVRKNNKKIIAVGTTSTRTLETIMHKYGEFRKCTGNTDIFIYPGFEFMAVDMQITNFHLPKSTLVMLVSAFSSRDIILDAYKKAVENKYRFFSFGDAMLIGDVKNDKK